MKQGYIYDQVLKLCRDKGATDTYGRNAAMQCQEEYNRGKYQTVSKLIDKHVADALKMTKRDKFAKQSTRKTK